MGHHYQKGDVSVTELADARLVDLAASTCGVRANGRWTVYVPGCRPGHGTTYLEAFAAALRTRASN